MKINSIILFAILLLFTVGCSRKTLNYRDQIRVLCRDNDALIVRCARFVVTGELYYLDKSNGKWGVRQKIDLKPYLKGWSIPYPDNGIMADNYQIKESFAYNDRWLCVLVKRETPGIDSGSQWKREANVLIFKKDKNVWKFHQRLSSNLLQRLSSNLHQRLSSNRGQYFADRSLALLDDNLFVADPFRKTDSSAGVVYCYELSDYSPKLVQTIFPPEIELGYSEHDENLCTTGVNRAPGIVVMNNRLVIAWSFLYGMIPLTAEQEEETKQKEEKRKEQSPTVLRSSIYHKTNEGWKWYGTFPHDLLSVKRITTSNDAVCCYWMPKRVRLYSLADGDLGTLIKSSPDIKTLDMEVLCDRHVRPPFGYNVFPLGKKERLGVIKPSADEALTYVEPDWIIEDADPETNRAMVEYYRSLKSYYGYSESFIKSKGYDSYYDVTDYIPAIDYHVCNSTLISSYVFDECYFDGVLASADVWAGVNIYEIDPEKGPKRVFAMTTRDLEELKVVPVEDCE